MLLKYFFLRGCKNRLNARHSLFKIGLRKADFEKSAYICVHGSWVKTDNIQGSIFLYKHILACELIVYQSTCTTIAIKFYLKHHWVGAALGLIGTLVSIATDNSHV